MGYHIHSSVFILTNCFRKVAKIYVWAQIFGYRPKNAMVICVCLSMRCWWFVRVPAPRRSRKHGSMLALPADITKCIDVIEKCQHSRHQAGVVVHFPFCRNAEAEAFKSQVGIRYCLIVQIPALLLPFVI